MLLWLLVTALIFGNGCDSSRSHPPRFTSYSHLYRIGIAITRYEYDNNELPRGFSELVPKYIPFEQIGIFYVTNEYAANPTRPLNWDSDSSLLNESASYAYLGKSNIGGVLAFEKFDLWKPGTANTSQLAVLFTDFHVESIPTQKLREMLSAKTR